MTRRSISRWHRCGYGRRDLIRALGITVPEVRMTGAGDRACAAMVHTTDRVAPDTALTEAYQPIQALFREAYRSNQPLFSKLGGA